LQADCHIAFISHFMIFLLFFFSSRRRHTRSKRDWSSDVCSSDLRLRQFSGNYEDYRAAIAQEQEAAQQKVRDAKSTVKKEKQERAALQTNIARGAKQGKKNAINRKKSRIALGNDKVRAQMTAAKQTRIHEQNLAKAEESLNSAQR